MVGAITAVIRADLNQLSQTAQNEADEQTDQARRNRAFCPTCRYFAGKTQHKHFRLTVCDVKPKNAQSVTDNSFRPEDMRIIEGSPTRRRKFLDEVIASFDAEYLRSLHL